MIVNALICKFFLKVVFNWLYLPYKQWRFLVRFDGDRFGDLKVLKNINS